MVFKYTLQYLMIIFSFHLKMVYYVDLLDILFGLRFQFVVGSEEPSCVAACDVNGDGFLDISDSVYSLFFHFVLGHPQPPFPYPSCGVSELPRDGLLGCDEPPPNCSTKE